MLGLKKKKLFNSNGQGQVPRMDAKKLLEQFSAAVAALQDRIGKMSATHLIPEEALLLLCASNNITETVKTGGEKEINTGRFDNFQKCVARVIREMTFYENQYKFFTKYGARKLREMIIELDSRSYREEQPEIESRFSAFAQLSTNPDSSLDALRTAYANVEKLIESAREKGARERIRLVLNPQPSRPAPDRKRDKRLRDGAIRDSMKGSENGGKHQKQKQRMA